MHFLTNIILYRIIIVSYRTISYTVYITWKMGTRTGCVSGKVVRRFGVKVSYKRNTISSCTILHCGNVPFNRLALLGLLLSRGSRHLMRQQNAVCCPSDDVRGSAGRVHPSASPSRLHFRTGCHRGPFGWLWSPQTAFFFILKQKWLETKR